jgi:glycine/D-amino acid oxidase-like deaminating enzyme
VSFGRLNAMLATAFATLLFRHDEQLERIKDRACSIDSALELGRALELRDGHARAVETIVEVARQLAMRSPFSIEAALAEFVPQLIGDALARGELFVVWSEQGNPRALTCFLCAQTTTSPLDAVHRFCPVHEFLIDRRARVLELLTRGEGSDKSRVL